MDDESDSDDNGGSGRGLKRGEEDPDTFFDLELYFDKKQSGKR